mgnify:CR=1 FL=1
MEVGRDVRMLRHETSFHPREPPHLALPERQIHFSEVLDLCRPVIDQAESKLARAVREVKILVQVWQALLVEPADPLDEPPLDRDVRSVEASPAGLGSFNVRVVELNPVV